MKMFIAKKWVEKNTKLAIENPYNGKIVGTVPVASKEDIENALKTLEKTKLELSAYERYEILLKTANKVKNKKKEIATLITKESGIPLKMSLHEIDRAYQALIFSAEEAKRIEGETLPADIIPGVKAKFALTMREPVGTVLCITPFNHPLNQVVHKVGPAIAAGNKVILKPSEKTPLTAILFVRILLEAGLPKDAIALITGHGKKIGDALFSDERVNMVSFTGSVAVGEYITKNIGVKKTCLELGGNAALVIFPDADIKKAVDVAVKGAFSNNGQRCTSIKRILCHKSISKRFVTPFVEEVKKLKCGDPLKMDTDIGPLIDKKVAEDIENKIGKAIKDGAKLLCGGNRRGALLEATVLDNVSPRSEMVIGETFGPTAPIIYFKEEKEAIDIVNSTIYGLQSGIFTQDIDRAFRVAKAVRVGGVVINEGPGFRVESLPFGGVKKSGLGREGIKCAVRGMTNLKTIIL